MKKSWIFYYVKLLANFSIYYFLNSHIGYSFILREMIMNSSFVILALIPAFFVRKKCTPRVCGFFSEGIVIGMLVFHSIHTLSLSIRNVGEAGFGIAEIMSLIPLFIMNLVFFVIDFRHRKDCHIYTKEK